MDVCVNKMSKAVQVNFDEDIPNYVPLNKYWGSLAEYKRVELEQVLEENERLYNLREVLLEINQYFKEMLKESTKRVVTTSQDDDEKENNDDLGIEVNNDNKS